MPEKFICPRCNEMYDEDDLASIDVGGSEDMYGSKVHMPCIIFRTTCCGVEPEEIRLPWYAFDKEGNRIKEDESEDEE